METAHRRGFFDINRRYPNIIKERDNWDIIVGARIPLPAVRDEGGRSANEPQSAECGSILHDNGELRTDHPIRPYLLFFPLLFEHFAFILTLKPTKQRKEAMRVSL